MQEVSKKKKHSLRHGRLVMLIGAIAVLLGGWGAYVLVEDSQVAEVEKKVFTNGEIHSYQPENVQHIAITLRSGESWAVTRQADGTLRIDGEDAAVDAGDAAALLNATCVVAYEDTLTDDPAEYAEHLADFGLDTPKAIVAITYDDGVRCTMRIGERGVEEDSGFYYMTVDGDSRLFALDRGTAEELIVQKNTLYAVTQPTLHKDRFDRITFTSGNGEIAAQWELQGDIGSNAQDRWLLTAPVRYAADGQSMANLQSNLENIRLGAYIGPASPENLTAYGFDVPRFTLTIHQAAGSIGTTDAAGVYSVTDWPEETFTMVIGGVRNDSVDYVLVGESIYISSHYSLAVFMDMNPRDTLSRYAVPVALGNLKTLTVEKEGRTDVYTLNRTEQVAENNELVTDADGNVVYDVACEKNGAQVSYAAFESAYNSLLLVTISGTLPQGWDAAQSPHTTFIFEDVTGAQTVVSLTPYDAMHDAVLINGNAVFYLINNGMPFEI